MTGAASRATDYVLESLGDHDRREFSCGVEALDRYLQHQIGQDARKRVAVPYVLVVRGQSTVMGYYTLSGSNVGVGDWPDGVARILPRYPYVPVTLLGRLAIDRGLQGKGVGEVLLGDALKRSLAAASQVESVAVIADAKDDAAEAFYKRYGFTNFPWVERRLSMPMQLIQKVF